MRSVSRSQTHPASQHNTSDPMQNIELRLMTEEDLPGADILRRLAGWNQTAEDWSRMLRLEPTSCFVATLGGAVVGTVTTTTYGQALAWVGMMLVHPEHRRQGIGTRLMQQALRSLHEKKLPCVKLDATPAGFPLYQQLGFVRDWTLTRHQRGAVSWPLPEHNVAPDTRPLTESDWSAVTELDKRAFGACRVDLLRSLAKDSRRALVWPTKGPVLGWGLLRPGTNAEYLGPVTCSSDEGSLALVAALLRGTEERSVFWDAPDQNSAAQAAAREFGFTPLRPLTRMHLGKENVLNAPGAQFAIADPALG
jgi:predicted N-acetyltransferase YhbS